MNLCNGLIRIWQGQAGKNTLFSTHRMDKAILRQAEILFGQVQGGTGGIPAIQQKAKSPVIFAPQGLTLVEHV